jgi:predicted Zn-ribbon and HTH transcriptional regulator
MSSDAVEPGQVVRKVLEEAEGPVTVEEIFEIVGEQLSREEIGHELETLRKQGAALLDDEGGWSLTP